MIIYNYDAITKEYTHPENAYIDPEATKRTGTEVYFIPPNTTTIEPVEAPEGYVTVFEDDIWTIKKDYRGRYQIDESMTITIVKYIGDIEEGYVLLTDEQYEQILERPEYYVVQNGRLVVNPRLPEIEAEKLAKRYMTKWDFIKHILNPLGFTYAMLKEVLSKDINLEEAWECCSYVYRGDETLCANIQKLLPGATPEYLDEAFKAYGIQGGE